MSRRHEMLESAALAVVACPFGGWPETEQAWRQYSDEAGRWLDRAPSGWLIGNRQGSRVYTYPDPVNVARSALARGATRPARAGEWGL